MRKRSFIALAAAVMLLCSFQTARAHKVNVFAYVEGGTVHTESYFPDGKACMNAKIVVKSPDGVTLLEGITDGDGLFSFPAPQKTNLQIILEAGLGHQGEYTVKASELPDVKAPDKKTAPGKTAAPATEKAAAEKPVDNKAEQKQPAGETPGTAEPAAEENTPPAGKPGFVPSDCAQYLDPLIQEEFNERLPKIVEGIRTEIRSEMRRDTGKVSPTEIFGGIGYIIGLMGLWMFFMSRKKGQGAG